MKSGERSLRVDLEDAPQNGNGTAYSYELRIKELESKIHTLTAKHKEELEEMEKKRTSDLSEVWDEYWKRVHEMENLRDNQDAYSDNLRETLREMERENIELRGKIRTTQTLMDQIQTMEEQMNAFADGLGQKELEIEELRRELEKKAKLIQQLEQQRVNSKGSSEEVELLRHQLEERDHEVHILRERLSRADSPTSRDRDRIASLEKSLKAARDERERAILAEEAARLQVDDMEKRLHRMMERESMKGEKDAELVETQRALLQSKDRELREARTRISELEVSLERMKEIEALQKRLLREKQEKNDNLVSLVDEQRDKIKVLHGDSTSRSFSVPVNEERWERSSYGSGVSGRQSGLLTRDSAPPYSGKPGFHSKDDAPRPPRSPQPADRLANSHTYEMKAGYTSDNSSITAHRRSSREREDTRSQTVDGIPRSGHTDMHTSSLIDSTARTPTRREWERTPDRHLPGTRVTIDDSIDTVGSRYSTRRRTSRDVELDEARGATASEEVYRSRSRPLDDDEDPMLHTATGKDKRHPLYTMSKVHDRDRKPSLTTSSLPRHTRTTVSKDTPPLSSQQRSYTTSSVGTKLSKMPPALPGRDRYQALQPSRVASGSGGSTSTKPSTVGDASAHRRDSTGVRPSLKVSTNSITSSSSISSRPRQYESKLEQLRGQLQRQTQERTRLQSRADRRTAGA